MAHSDDSEEEDDLLSFDPFSQSSVASPSCDNKQDTPVKSYLGSQEGSPVKESSVSQASPCPHSESSCDIVEELARRRAANAVLPSIASLPTELMWHVQLSKAARNKTGRKSTMPIKSELCLIAPTSYHIVYPVRICDVSEAHGLDLKHQSMNPSSQSVVQYFVEGMTVGDRAIVSNSAIYPFHNLKNPNDKSTWCPLLLKRFQAQCKKKLAGKYTQSDALAQAFFLERILEQARQAYASKKSLYKEESIEQKMLEEEHEEDLESPYAQNLKSTNDQSSDEDDWRMAASMSKTREAIRRGDVLQYRSPLFVAGDKRGERVATVVKVRPGQDPPLVLDNGEVLLEDTQVRRIKKLRFRRRHGERQYFLEDHPTGLFRPIVEFRLSAKSNSEFPILCHKTGNIVTNHCKSMEAQRLDQIIQRNVSKVKSCAAEMGMPVDLTRTFSRKDSPSRRIRGKPPLSQRKPDPRKSRGPMMPTNKDQKSDENDDDLSFPSRKQDDKKFKQSNRSKSALRNNDFADSDDEPLINILKRNQSLNHIPEKSAFSRTTKLNFEVRQSSRRKSASPYSNSVLSTPKQNTRSIKKTRLSTSSQVK